MKRLISTAFVLGFVVFVVRVVGAQGGQGPAGGLHRVAHGSSMVGSGTTASQLDVLAGSGLFIDASGLEIGCGSGVSCAADQIYVDTSYVQKRVTGTCASGNYVRVINADGTVTCGVDSSGAGTITSLSYPLNGGMSLAGSTISSGGGSFGLRTDCSHGSGLEWHPALEDGVGEIGIDHWACTTLVETAQTGPSGGVEVDSDATGTAYSGQISVNLLSTCASGQVLKSGGLGGVWGCADDSSGAQLGTANTFTASQNVASAVLTDGASIATDASLSNVFTVTIAGNRTLANPTNLVAGGTYTWVVTQDGTGSRTLAYGSAFTWQGGIVPSLSTTASAVDVISAVYDGSKLRASIGKTYQ